MQRTNASYQEWLDKVEEDEFAGKEILDGRRFAAPACFHFQQMTEKLLKALLIFYNIPFPKIHDLIALAGILEPTMPEIKNYKSDLEFLGRYYVETRYPGDYPEFTLEECERALESALRIKEFVLSKVKPSETNGGFGLVGIIIAVAVVVLAAGGGLYYYRNQQPMTNNPQQTVGDKSVVVDESITDTSNWKTHTNDVLTFKYPPDWNVVNFDYANSVFIENTKKSITITISEGPYPFGFSGPMEVKENPIKIIVDGKEYHTKENIIENKNVYVNFELDASPKYNILFGTGYPAGDDKYSSLEDYHVLKDTILKILFTFKFIK